MSVLELYFYTTSKGSEYISLYIMHFVFLFALLDVRDVALWSSWTSGSLMFVDAVVVGFRPVPKNYLFL